MSAGQGGNLNGFVPFPADNAWNQDISSAAVDSNSAAIINFIGSTVPVHPDFGSGLYSGSSIGIPYLIVDSTQGPVTINFTAYGDESDPGPMPIPATAPIEGYPAPGMATATSSCSTMRIAGSMSSTARIRKATARGTQLRLRSGT